MMQVAAWPSAPQPINKSPAELQDRIRGMLLGLAIGDALGNTSEPLLPAERRRLFGEVTDYLPNRKVNDQRVGLPSDDTQLAFWTLRQMLNDDAIVPANIAQEFTSHKIFGIGSAVRGFLREMHAGTPSNEAGQASMGNGSLMRIAPVLIPHLRKPSAQLWKDTAIVSAITHNERGAIAACVAFISLLWDALQLDATPSPDWWPAHFIPVLKEVEGNDTRYETRDGRSNYSGPLWRHTQNCIDAATGDRLEPLAACNLWYSGAYLMETVPSLLYILICDCHDPDRAIIRAVNDTRDNDTTAAIVGAAVGALHGAKALPQRWIDGLTGRTEEGDDGEVFRLIDEAVERWV